MILGPYLCKSDFVMHLSFVRYVLDAMRAWNEAHSSFTKTLQTSMYETFFWKKDISTFYNGPNALLREWCTVFHFVQVGPIKQRFKRTEKKKKEKSSGTAEPIVRLYRYQSMKVICKIDWIPATPKQ